jgi:DNA primase
VRIDERFLEELKSRLRLSEVIGRSVKLRRQGREFVGLSPFAKEKTPSFYVNDDKGFFHDFSSGKHGDLISFLQETERLSFMEAIERLAAEAGMDLPQPSARDAAEEKARAGLTHWLDLAAQWYQSQLLTPGGENARSYLGRRGLEPDLWPTFGIGFAPGSRTALKDYLIAKGGRPAELVESGLLIAPDDGGAPYDRFRDRIMFPIADARNRIISFGGRALDPNARAKYLNGPDTVLFDKGKVLYGLPGARRLLHRPGQSEPGALVVVEGYMDVIACHRAEIAAVAPMGTALGEAQMDMLWRLHEEPTLCFDGDGAGRRAAARTLERALPLLKPGKSFRLAVVEGGKDPDDVLRDQGAVALREQMSRTVPFVEALFLKELQDHEPLDTPERRTGLKVSLRKVAASIADPDLAKAYKDDLLNRFDILTRPAGPGVAAKTQEPWTRKPWKKGLGWGERPLEPATREGRVAATRLQETLDPLGAALAKAALADPVRLDDCLEDMERWGLFDPALGELAKEIIRIRLSKEALDSELLARHLSDNGFSALIADIDRAAPKAGAPFLRDNVSLEASRSGWLKAFGACSRLAALELAIEATKASPGGDISMDALKQLKGERDLLRRDIRSGAIWIADTQAGTSGNPL